MAREKQGRGDAQGTSREGMRPVEGALQPGGTGPGTRERPKRAGRATDEEGKHIVTRPVRIGEGRVVVDTEGREHVAQPSRAHSPPTRTARASGARSSGARGKGGGGRSRPSDAGAHASSGRSGSVHAASAAGQHQVHATVRGAASSGEQRGTTLGARAGTRTAGSTSRGTVKIGARRGARRAPPT